jgi:hypothetical protein
MWPHRRWWSPIPLVTIGLIIIIGPTAPVGAIIPIAITGPTILIGTITIIRIATIGPTVPMMVGLLMARGGERACKDGEVCAGMPAMAVWRGPAARAPLRNHRQQPKRSADG